MSEVIRSEMADPPGAKESTGEESRRLEPSSIAPSNLPAPMCTVVGRQTVLASAELQQKSEPERETTDGSASILEAWQLYKGYRKGRYEISVLRGVELRVWRGEFVAVVGASGSGKSTLLHLLGTLDVPDRGEVWFEGRRLDTLSPREKDRVRNQEIAFIFQFYHLLPELTVLENVMMPMLVRCSAIGWLWHRWSARKRARQLLEHLGLIGQANRRPAELSGGELQRAAIARALFAQPKLLLADEPTGNLDAANASEIARLLRDLNRNERVTIIMVTHNWELARQADRILRLADGQLHPIDAASV